VLGGGSTAGFHSIKGGDLGRAGSEEAELGDDHADERAQDQDEGQYHALDAPAVRRDSEFGLRGTVENPALYVSVRSLCYLVNRSCDNPRWAAILVCALCLFAGFGVVLQMLNVSRSDGKTSDVDHGVARNGCG